ncbi:recombinase family protein [Streptomyces sp. NPDC059874]|uniref:recombinase family protein n=1 Tax=Streptomyces sp. NPDC059874 TaxID=3346983 RepID=UPI00364E70AD
MTTHAAGYDRQSAERASGSVASPATQRAANKGEADRRIRAGEDVVWINHYSEAPGTSAFSGVDRPVWRKLVEDCQHGKINMIIVNYISRLTRQDPLEAIPELSNLLALGVTIVSVNEGTFTKGNVMDLIHLIMRLEAAHNESRNKSIAVRDAAALARSLGGHTGRVPYGFDTEFRMVPNPADRGKLVQIRVLVHRTKKLESAPMAEPEVVQWLWREIKAHMDVPFLGGGAGSFHPGSISGLVVRLYNEGIPTRGAEIGKKSADSDWDASVVKRILRDPRIAGYRAVTTYKTKPDGKRGGFDGYRIERDPVTMKPLLLECGALIPPAEWHELQTWLDGRGRGKGLSRGQSLLTAMDVLYCAGDPEKPGSGAVMTAHTRTGKDAKLSTYQCKCKKGVHTSGGSCAISYHLIDNYVAGRIFALVQTAEDDEDTLRILHEATMRFGKLTEAPETAGERSALVVERADAARALEELYEDRAAGAYAGPIGRKAFLKEQGILTFRMQGAEERLRDLEAAQNPVLPLGTWLASPDGDPLGPDSWWAKADLADKRTFVKLFIDRIEVRKLTPGENRPGRVPNTAGRVKITWAEPEEIEDEEETTAAA